MPTIKCLTSAIDIVTGGCPGHQDIRVTIEYVERGCVVEIAMRFRSQRHDSDGRMHVVCSVSSGHFVTLIAPSDDVGAEVEVVDHQRIADLIDGRLSAVPPAVAALEESLRWQSADLVDGPPARADDGPYARHPRLYQLPQTARQEIATLLAQDRPIGAIRVLRDCRPAMTLREAHVLITALRLYG